MACGTLVPLPGCTHAPCVEARILNPWTTRDALYIIIYVTLEIIFVLQSVYVALGLCGCGGFSLAAASSGCSLAVMQASHCDGFFFFFLIFFKGRAGE